MSLKAIGRFFSSNPPPGPRPPGARPARRRHGGHPVRQLEVAEVAGRQAIEHAECVTGHAVDAQDDPGVLDAGLVVVQLGADGADARLEHLAHHLREPLTGDDLGVVVEEAHDVAGRCAAPRRCSAPRS